MRPTFINVEQRDSELLGPGFKSNFPGDTRFATFSIERLPRIHRNNGLERGAGFCKFEEVRNVARLGKDDPSRRVVDAIFDDVGSKCVVQRDKSQVVGENTLVDDLPGCETDGERGISLQSPGTVCASSSVTWPVGTPRSYAELSLPKFNRRPQNAIIAQFHNTSSDTSPLLSYLSVRQPFVMLGPITSDRIPWPCSQATTIRRSSDSKLERFIRRLGERGIVDRVSARIWERC